MEQDDECLTYLSQSWGTLLDRKQLLNRKWYKALLALAQRSKDGRTADLVGEHKIAQFRDPRVLVALAAMYKYG